MNKLNKNHKTKQCAIPSVGTNFIFDKDLIEKAMISDKPYYTIGVDINNKGTLVYCLTRKKNGVIEMLLSKKGRK